MSVTNDRLLAVEALLDEAGREIPAELQKLREQIANGQDAEAQETITRLEARSAALAGIIPNATAPEPTPTPTPE
jgi:predicted lipid carrier protein YhbT